MLRRSIKAENMKLKGSKLWLACLFIPCIPAIMGTFNYLQNLGMLSESWYSLWTQITLFYANFFYAPLIAVYCAYMWRLEHLEHNWNVLMSVPVKYSDVFLAKLAVILKVTIVLQIWVGILYLICGKIVGLPGIMPIEILWWLVRGTIAGMVISAIQLLLSMVIRSFAIPIGLALIGSVAGFLFVSMGNTLIWPYALMVAGMNANRSNDVMSGELIQFLISVVIFMGGFIGIAVNLLRRRDVRAD